MNTSYFRSRFLGAKRISKLNPEIFNFEDLTLGVEEESPDEALQNDTLGLTSRN
jgi:hypothetical protein